MVNKISSMESTVSGTMSVVTLGVDELDDQARPNAFINDAKRRGVGGAKSGHSKLLIFSEKSNSVNSANGQPEAVNGSMSMRLESASKTYTFTSAFTELFLRKKTFMLHRVTGLLYLIQFMLAFVLLCFNFDYYLSTPLGWTLPVTGWLQAIIASKTFTFLPNGVDAQGYYSDKRTITYSFLLENIYFSGLLMFQALYCFTPVIEKIFPKYGEAVLVFLPYLLIRTWFPKTSLGESRNIDSQYTSKNRQFLKFISLLSKAFYVWAKHFNGYYLNYMIWLGLVKDSPKAIYKVHWLLLAAGWATTVAMFLNTLKFKKMIGPRTALAAYAGTFPIIVSFLTLLQVQYNRYAWVSFLVLMGVPINFLPRHWHAKHVYQVLVLALFWKLRKAYISEAAEL